MFILEVYQGVTPFFVDQIFFLIRATLIETSKRNVRVQ